jgi:hypothetical protein
MIMLHGAESSAKHSVLEVVRRVIRSDLRGEPLADEEVARAPGNGVAKSEKASGGAAFSDGLFAEVSVAGQMNFYATGEVEDAGDWSIDLGDFFKSYHALQ